MFSALEKKKSPQRYIITGGPGSGKTSLIHFLRESGYQCYPEIADDLINQGLKPPMRTGQANPAYYKAIISGRLKHFEDAANFTISFFDRGLPDSLVYQRFLGIGSTRALLDILHSYRYADPVFILEPNQSLFRNSSTRSEHFQTSVELFEITKQVYQELGYTFLLLRRTNFQDLLDQIIEEIQ